MLSGIGPAAHLAEHEIPVIAALPGVGEHLMDHAVVDVALAETSGNSLTFLLPKNLWHWIKRMHAIFTYTLTGRGPLTCVVCFFLVSLCRPDSDKQILKVAEGAAFFRSTDPALFPQHASALPANTEDSTSGPYAPDLEFFSSPMGYVQTGKGSLPDTEMLGLHMVLLRWAWNISSSHCMKHAVTCFTGQQARATCDSSPQIRSNTL
jgi:choline dehydrogenase